MCDVTPLSKHYFTLLFDSFAHIAFLIARFVIEKTAGGDKSNNKEEFKFQCHRYRKYGHKAIECRQGRNTAQSVQATNKAEYVSLYIIIDILLCY